MNKYIIGVISFIAIALVAMTTFNQQKIEVTAEANATSTVIVPTSTRTIVPITTSTTSTVSHETPQTVIIYQTYETPVAGSMVEVVPEVKPETKPEATPEITYVPTPIYTTVYVPAEPVYTPPVTPPVVLAPEPTVDPEPVVEPFYSEFPHYWIEERTSGRLIFFQATWSDGIPGQIVCNGIKIGRPPKSGIPSTVEEKHLTDLIDGGSMTAPERYVSCTFSVGDNGGVTANITVK